MMRKLSHIVFLCAFCAASILSYAQPDIGRIENLTTADGLSNNTINDMVFDTRGFLWVATTNGLNRYDGTEFEYYFAADDDRHPSSNLCFRLLMLDSTHLAMGTNNGINILDLNTSRFRKISFDVSPGMDKELSPYLNSIVVLEKDKSGNIWVGTRVALMRLDTSFRIKDIWWSNYDKDYLNRERVRFVVKVLPMAKDAVLVFLQTGSFVWSATKKGDRGLEPVADWNKGKLNFIKKIKPERCFLVRDYLLYIRNDADSLFLYDQVSGRQAACFFPDNKMNEVAWRQTASWLYDGWVTLTFENKGMAFIKVDEHDFSIKYQPSHYLTSAFLKNLKVGADGTLWAASDYDGLLKIHYRDNLFHIQEPAQFLSNLPASFEMLNIIRKDGLFYIGTDGKGIYEWNMQTGTFVNFRLDENGKRDNWCNYVWNLRNGKGDTLWTGTQIGLLWFNTKNKTSGRITTAHNPLLDTAAITTQFTDSRGWVWMGLGMGNGVCIFNPHDNSYRVIPSGAGNYPYRYPIAIAEDSRGDVWFVNDNSLNLVKWDHHNEKFSVKKMDLPRAGTKAMEAVCIDKNDLLWFGIESMGLICYNIRTGKIEPDVTPEQSTLNGVRDIFPDRKGNIWIVSENLSRIDLHKRRLQSYLNDYQNGFQNLTAKFFFDTLSGNLWAASGSKMVYFKPDAVKTSEEQMPVLVTDLLMKGEDVPLTEKQLKFGYKDNDLQISFTGINLKNGRENRYAYRINDGPWQDLQKERKIRLVSLAPGSYDVEVRGARQYADWSPQTAHVRFVITPPFTATIWFYLVLLAGGFAIFYLWYRLRIHHYLKMQKMRSQLSRDLHDELGSKLTTISYLSLGAQSRAGENKELTGILERINDYSMRISSSLREIIWTVNPRADNLNILMSRLTKFAAEMLELKDIDLDFSVAELPETLVLKPSERKDFEMIFREAITNITKHANARRVLVSVNRTGKKLTILIKDDGKGFAVAAGTHGYGISNMESRARAHHWKFEITSERDVGTTVTLEIKITKMWY